MSLSKTIEDTTMTKVRDAFMTERGREGGREGVENSQWMIIPVDARIPFRKTKPSVWTSIFLRGIMVVFPKTVRLQVLLSYQEIRKFKHENEVSVLLGLSL